MSRLEAYNSIVAELCSLGACRSMALRHTHCISYMHTMERKNMLDDDGFKYLNRNHPTGAFDRLQKMYLRGIPRMKHLFRGVIKPPSLHNLTVLKIESCPSVKSLFSESVALCMANLQQLSISDCEMLEEIIWMDTEFTQMIEYTKDGAKISVLSQLKSLTLVFLPKLVHFTRTFPKGIFIFENLTELRVKKCDNLRYLFSPSMANSLLALKYVRVWKCEAIEEIIERQEGYDTLKIEIVEEGMTRIVIPKLRTLSLRTLYRFKTLSSQNYDLMFPLLELLCIEDCPMMTKLCSGQLSAPNLDKVWTSKERSVDISNFWDSEGSI